MICAPSFLTADFSQLETEIVSLKKAKWLHFDVMDGIFVPNLTYGEEMLDRVKAFSNQFFDCHLMIANPLERYRDFIDAGADMITFHYEAAKEKSANLIAKIKGRGCLSGMSIKPATKADLLDPFLKDLDLVLVMSVEPGKGGQEFMPEALDKIRYYADQRSKNNYHFLIEVDGGINDKTAVMAKTSGADIVVAGSYIINQKDREKAIEVLENV